MKKIINIKKDTNNKFLNLYSLTYQDDKKQYEYYMASRRDEKNLSCLGSDKTDAVRIIPYFVKDKKIYIVLIYEFRHPIGCYIYSVPAGLIDEGESFEQAAKRELMEEIGAKVVSLKQTEKPSYSSVGLTDEKLVCFEAQVDLIYKQQLDENEDIKIKIIALDELEEFLDNNQFGLQSALQLRGFIYKKKLEQLKGKI